MISKKVKNKFYLSYLARNWEVKLVLNTLTRNLSNKFYTFKNSIYGAFLEM